MKDLLVIVSFIIFGTFVVWFIVTSNQDQRKFGFQEGYKAACQDFYNGKLKMDLVENEDGTKEWKWLK